MSLSKENPRDISIAEWLGWKLVRENELPSFHHQAGWVVPDQGYGIIIRNKLNFRYDWQQLMAVVDKIEADVDSEGSRPRVTIDTRFVRIDDKEYLIVDGKPKQDIVWAAVSDYCLAHPKNENNIVTPG
ncbi:hypothetical protein GCM10028806_33640 [Spirosoma terrae]|uniref:Uncharacterized protein n=1 Tax=Spirosoma terrae TaxID=1968276 RepID=A0A6L9L865_9BACT|nr:hypothetical protein [Spirosoma terrae]NDU95677.1 hypothetical protein [Spirosoma terrae]